MSETIAERTARLDAESVVLGVNLKALAIAHEGMMNSVDEGNMWCSHEIINRYVEACNSQTAKSDKRTPQQILEVLMSLGYGDEASIDETGKVFLSRDIEEGEDASWNEICELDEEFKEHGLAFHHEASEHDWVGGYVVEREPA